MPLAYLILICLSFFAARNHFPFSNLPVMLGIFLLLIDVIIQIIRKFAKRTHTSVWLSSITLVIVSVGYAFVWLSWPGGFFTGLFGLVCGVFMIFYWLRAKQKINLRFVSMSLIVLALGCFTFMKPSTFLCVKNNIDKHNPKAPIFILHDLSWRLNKEGNSAESMRILNLERKVVTKKLEYLRGTNQYDAYYKIVFKEDSAIIENAFSELSKGKWVNYQPMLPEDFFLE